MSSAPPLLCTAMMCLLASGCSSREEPGDGADAGPDARTAAGDAGDAPDAGADGGPPVDAGPLTGESRLYIVSFMDLAAEVSPGVADGFDIDRRVSDETDAQSCRKSDYTSPPPASTPGVDNQLGPLLAEAEGTFHIRANLESNIQSGEILLLLDVRGIDDYVDDDRVEVDALVGLLPAGTTAPTLDASGRIAGGQTFDVDAMSVAADMTTALITLRGRIEGGRLLAGPGDFTMSLPLEGMRVAFEAKNAEIAFDITETALSNGVVGGALDVESTVAAMEGVEGFDAATARLLLRTNADLERDEVEMRCESISIALVFDGADAVRGINRTP